MKNNSFKNWSKSDKRAVSFAVGMVAFCGALTALYFKEKDYKHAIFQGTCTAINATCTMKMIQKAQKEARERN